MKRIFKKSLITILSTIAISTNITVLTSCNDMLKLNNTDSTSEESNKDIEIETNENNKNNNIETSNNDLNNNESNNNEITSNTVLEIPSYLIDSQGLLYELQTNLTYSVRVGRATNLSKITIMDSYKGLKVASIAESGFQSCYNLTTITIPDSITTISDYAFNDCINLTSINIPNSVGYIGDDAFAGCSNLNSATLGNNVYYIADKAFADCTNLKKISIPESVTTIGSEVFLNCTSLEYNTYNNAYYIGNDNNKFMMLIKACNTNINSCTINANCKFILENSFAECSKLKSITFNEGLLNISDKAFSNCEKLSIIIFPNSLLSIGEYAFENCYNLVSITLGTNINYIDYYAFHWCYSLLEVINKSTYNFSCERYMGPRYEKNEGESDIVNINDYLFYGKSFIRYIGDDTNLVLPESYNGETYGLLIHSFNECHDITSIVIPLSVTKIDYAVFGNCTKLKSIYYKGTYNDWSNMSIDEYCYLNFSQTTIYYYSDTKPTDTSYNYWHYVDGVATPWE